MLETLIEKDKELLIFLNNLGSEQWDWLWLGITNQFHWSPLFAFILFLVFKKFGWKNGIIILLSYVVLVTFSDQFVNFIKNSFERLRPVNDPSINEMLRKLVHPGGYSFVSGHATTSTFFTVFTVFLLKDAYKYIKWVFIFPILFAYSRLYLGVHFPLDIICGGILGATFGYGYYKLVRKIFPKLFLNA